MSDFIKGADFWVGLIFGLAIIGLVSMIYLIVALIREFIIK